MDIKKKTQEELEKKVKELEQFIASKGVGSGYLARAERFQRNVNVALFLGISLSLIGLSVWLFSGDNKD